MLLELLFMALINSDFVKNLTLPAAMVDGLTTIFSYASFISPVFNFSALFICVGAYLVIIPAACIARVIIDLL